MIKSALLKVAAAAFAGALIASVPASAQVRTIDPNRTGEYEPAAQGPIQPEYQPIDNRAPAQAAVQAEATASAAASDRASHAVSGTVGRGEVFSAAEGVFGRGAQGLAEVIEDILSKQGQPSAYITGREAGGALVAGVRYGSGILHHGVEGDRPVYWTGPSVGFDFGADANKVFVLVYNLHDSQEIFKRYPGAEGNAYVIGGFTASYMRRGDVVLIPVRMGVGVRLGLNAGYMRFTEKSRWLPF